MTDEDLLPCPHCGGPASFKQVPDEPDQPFRGRRYVECDNSACGASTVLSGRTDELFARNDLAARWNNRHALPTAPKGPAPKFPTALRKQWSGTEVQDWINSNWANAVKKVLSS